MQTTETQKTITDEIQTAVRHSVMYGLGNVLAKVLGFLMLPLYTHYLNPIDYGIMEILDLSMSLFGMFLTMGMTASVLRTYAAAASAEEKRTVIHTAFLFVTVTGLVTFVVGLGLARHLSTMIFGPGVPPKYLLLSLCAFVLLYISNLPRTFLRALEASGTFTLVDSVSLFLTLALNIYFIAVARIGLVGMLLSPVLVGILQVVLLSGWTIRKVGIGFHWPYMRQMLEFGWPLMFSNLAIFALNFSDRFFLKHLQSLDVVGIYAVGYKFGFMINFLVIQPFYVMWQARMYIIHAQPEHPKIFDRIFVLYSLLVIYAGLALAVMSPEIVRLMVASKFSSSQEVIPPVALAYVFWGIGFYSQLGMYVTNKTNLIGIISAAAAILNLGLNYVLILRYGMMGAAWATVLGFLAIAVGSYCCSQRVYPLPLRVGRVSLTLLLAVGLYMLSRWCNPGSLGIALMIKGILLGAFPVLLWKLRILSPAEIGTLASARNNAVAGFSRRFGFASGGEVRL